jgi:hypothetical protein
MKAAADRDDEDDDDDVKGEEDEEGDDVGEGEVVAAERPLAVV